MKNEVAGEGEVATVPTGAGSPGWLAPLSRHGDSVVLLLLLLGVTVVHGASGAVTALTASAIEP